MDFLQPLRSARYLRIMRTVRILRIVKAGKINVLLENLVISLGRQWLILAFTVGKMLLVIGAVAHILACIWYALGDTISQERDSWLQIAQVGDAPFQTQYIHSLSWILLTPSPAPLEPDSNIEHTAVGSREFCLCLVGSDEYRLSNPCTCRQVSTQSMLVKPKFTCSTASRCWCFS